MEDPRPRHKAAINHSDIFIFISETLKFVLRLLGNTQIHAHTPVDTEGTQSARHIHYPVSFFTSSERKPGPVAGVIPRQAGGLLSRSSAQTIQGRRQVPDQLETRRRLLFC